jgi:hypothetical protein
MHELDSITPPFDSKFMQYDLFGNPIVSVTKTRPVELPRTNPKASPKLEASAKRDWYSKPDVLWFTRNGNVTTIWKDDSVSRCDQSDKC